MKIKDKQGNVYEVFCIYWTRDQSNAFYWNGTKLSVEGLSGGMDSGNAEVIDPTIKWRGKYYSTGIMHWYLFENNLLEAIFEGDQIAAQKFYTVLRSEGFLGEKDLQRCRICGLLQDDLPWGKDDNDPTYELCGCCGAVFGIDDLDLDSIRKYRNDWVLGGHKWNREQEKPEDWLPETQIIEIPFNYR